MPPAAPDAPMHVDAAAAAPAARDLVATLRYTADCGAAARRGEGCREGGRVPVAGADPAAVPVGVAVRDARPLLRAGGLGLNRRGFTLVRHPTALANADFYESGAPDGAYIARLVGVYYAEMERVVREATGAAEVYVLAHQVRSRDGPVSFGDARVGQRVELVPHGAPGAGRFHGEVVEKRSGGETEGVLVRWAAGDAGGPPEGAVPRDEFQPKAWWKNGAAATADRAEDVQKWNPFADSDVAGYAEVVHTDYCAKKSLEKNLQGVLELRSRNLQDAIKAYAKKKSEEGEAKSGEEAKLLGTPHEGDAPMRHEGVDTAALLQKRYMLINAWRNISDVHPIANNTLAVCDAASVDVPGDLVRADVPIVKSFSTGELEVEYNVKPAEQYRLAARSAGRHRWCYFPEMEKDEVLLFKQFDSDPSAPARFCFHSSLHDPAADPSAPLRQSVEVRCVAFFSDPPAPQSAPAPPPAGAALPPVPAPEAPPAAAAACGCPNAGNPYHTCSAGCSCACAAPPPADGCGCKNAGPYHTCAPACGCRCGAEPAPEPVPEWIMKMYTSEDIMCSERNVLMAGLTRAHRKTMGDEEKVNHRPKYEDYFTEDTVLRRTGAGGRVLEVSGREAQGAAAEAAAASPVNRCTWVRSYRAHGGEGHTESGATYTHVIEGETTYDHKMTRAQLKVPFRAHLAFRADADGAPCVARRHTVPGDPAAAERFVAGLAAMWPAPLEMRLWAGAAQRQLPPAEVPRALDAAALNGVSPDAAVRSLFAGADPADWGLATGL